MLTYAFSDISATAGLPPTILYSGKSFFLLFITLSFRLDPIGRREVLATVERLRREKGMTVVLITHHMNECVDADRLIVMSGGAVVLDGSPKQVFSQVERLREEGLAVPETTELLYGLRQAGWDLPLDALSVEECADAIAQRCKRD